MVPFLPQYLSFELTNEKKNRPLPPVAKLVWGEKQNYKAKQHNNDNGHRQRHRIDKRKQAWSINESHLGNGGDLFKC